MLNEISWAEYLTAVAALTGTYYVVIGGIFHKGKIRKIVSNKWGEDTSDEPETNLQEDDAFAELEGLVVDLKDCMLEAAKGISKEELLVQLKERLISYGGLRRAAYQHALNDFIIDMAKDSCGVTFDEEELSAAWKTLPR